MDKVKTITDNDEWQLVSQFGLLLGGERGREGGRKGERGGGGETEEGQREKEISLHCKHTIFPF